MKPSKCYRPFELLPLAFGLLIALAPCEGSGGGAENDQAPSASSLAEAPSPSPPSGTSDGAAASSGATVFREHRIVDPGLNDMVATTVLVPKGWEVEGGITRPAPQYYSMPVLLDVKFVAPDGRQARQFPGYVFEFNNQQPAEPFSPTMDGNMYLPLPESPGAWLMEMARISPDPTMSNLRLVSEEMEPELTRQLRQSSASTYQMIDQTNATTAAMGFGMEFDTQVTTVVLQYTKDGMELEETILLAWQYMINVVQGQVTSGNWGIVTMKSLRGPVGSDYLNDPELMAIFQSARPNPAWVQEMNNYWTELARIRHRGATERRNHSIAAHQKRMQTLNETSEIISSGWKARTEMGEAGHQKFIDSIHEVTPYQTPSGETVKLPSFYDHVYTDNDGNYILNNDAFYEPNRDPAVNNRSWQRIEQRR